MSARRTLLQTALGVVAALVAAVGFGSAPPAGATNRDGTWVYTPITVNGGYTPVVGYFNADEYADVVWYHPGSSTFAIWYGTATQGSFTGHTFPVPLVGASLQVADLGGDELDDLLWYRTASAPAVVAASIDDGTSFATKTYTVGAGSKPIVLHDLADGHKDDVVLYRPGAASDALLRFADDGSGAMTYVPEVVNGTYTPVAGIWGGGDQEGIVWYAPGSAPDAMWLPTAAGGFTRKALTINGTYSPSTMWSDSGSDSIFWMGQGLAPDAATTFSPAGSVVNLKVQAPINATCTGTPFAVDTTLLYCGNADDLMAVRDGSTVPLFYATPTAAKDKWAGYVPLPGDFDGDGLPDILWYGPGSKGDEVWYADASGGPVTASARSVPTSRVIHR